MEQLIERLTERQRGVRQWKAKLPVVKRLLGVYTIREVVEKVFPDKSVREIDTIADSARRWHQHTPLLHREFFAALARKLGCGDHVTAVEVIESTFDEFVQLLPAEKQERVQRAADDLRAGPSHHDPDFGGRHVRFNVRGPFQCIASGVRAGHLDTRHYYSTADAAAAWSRLVSARAYRTYDQCRHGLIRLTETPQWQAAVAAARPTTAVMLAGGGAPTKDLVLLESLLQHSAGTHPITMVLVDIAPYMLHHSMELIEDALPELEGHERVRLEYVADDILSLGEQPVFRRSGSAVFAITGGTIGNLRELEFFRSLARLARDGDLLIVSADTVDGMSAEETERVLTTKYDHADVRRFIEPGVRAVVGEYNLRETLDAALKRVKVRVLPGAAARLSDVPKSTCVTLVLNNGRKDVILASSTRYSVEAFQQFAARQGWQSLCTVESPLNPHFVQMAFRRKAWGQSGTT